MGEEGGEGGTNEGKEKRDKDRAGVWNYCPGCHAPLAWVSRPSPTLSNPPFSSLLLLFSPFTSLYFLAPPYSSNSPMLYTSPPFCFLLLSPHSFRFIGLILSPVWSGQA